MHLASLAPLRHALTGAAVALLSLGAVAYAAITLPTVDGNIKVCVNDNRGVVKVILDAPDTCDTARETTVMIATRDGRVANADNATNADTLDGKDSTDFLELGTTLKSSKTLTGVYSAWGVGGGNMGDSVSFRIPLAADLDAAHVHWVIMGGSHPSCPGHGAAATGHLCVYETNGFNRGSGVIHTTAPIPPTAFFFGAHATGFGINFGTGAPASGTSLSYGTWAVTAP